MSILKTISRLNYVKLNRFSTVQTVPEVKIEIPKKPLRQKWLDFWKILFRDYKEVFGDVAENMKKHPFKSSIWISAFGFTCTCCALNPDELHYLESIRQKSNEIVFIGKPIRNPAAEQHLDEIELLYNREQIKRISFGLFSIILRDCKSKNSALYRDNCKYVQPTYLEMLKEDTIDVGFWNRWWILENKMIDYDINPGEWGTESSD